MRQLELVTSYRECHEILRNHRFGGAAGRPEGRAFLGDSVLLVDGEEHRDRRLMYLPLFREDRLQQFERTVVRPMLAAGYRAHFATVDDEGWRRGDLVALTRDVCMRLAAALIGLDNYAEPSSSRRLFQLLRPLGEAAAVEWSERDHAEVVREGLEAKAAYVEEFFEPAWRRRGERIVRGGGIDDADAVDLLAVLLGNWRSHWDDDLPVRESILVLAGSTGNPVGQIVYAFDDLRTWVAAHPEEQAELADEQFVRHAIDETLRLHVAGSPVLVREVYEDVTLASTGRTFKTGEFIGLDMVAANQDPEVFGADGDQFDPRRWARIPARVASYGVAFGGGSHTCLGRPLVLGRSMKMGIEGLEYLTLRSFLDSGVEPDPVGPPRLTSGGQLQYATYPVRLPAHAELLPAG